MGGDIIKNNKKVMYIIIIIKILLLEVSPELIKISMLFLLLFLPIA